MDSLAQRVKMQKGMYAMNMRLRALILAVYAMFVVGTYAESADKFSPSSHIVRTVAFWERHGRKETTLDEKVESGTSAEILDYLKKLNIYQGYIGQPVNFVPPVDFQFDLKSALREMPSSVKNLVTGKLIGIFLVNNLGSSAITVSVFDRNKRATKGWIAIDASLLDRTANEWITWKESSPFNADKSGLKLRVKLETSDNDNRKNAIQYVLLHEFGHLISIGYNDRPCIHINQSVFDPQFHSFISLSWNELDCTYSYKNESYFPELKGLTYYQGQETKTPVSNADQIYRSLEKTNFPSLYATMNPLDDFAESFATYVHSVVQNRPYAVKIFSNDRVISSFGACWKSERCKEKRKILESLLH